MTVDSHQSSVNRNIFEQPGIFAMLAANHDFYLYNDNFAVFTTGIVRNRYDKKVDKTSKRFIKC